MDLTRRKRKRARVAEVPFWWHSIDFGDGVVSPGRKDFDFIRHEYDSMQIPPLQDKTVLDIGAWDGFFSFEAERSGAKRVVALDHFVWCMNYDQLELYLAECTRTGVPPRPFDDVPELWYDDCPGKRGFDLAHDLLESSVEAVVADFMTTDLTELGTFDVVFYFGVLYHMRHPLLALERLRSVTGEIAIIESQAVYLPTREDDAWCAFFERDELQGDWSNWWSPNLTALTGMCRAAGFSSAEVVIGPPESLAALPPDAEPVQYRAVVHARP